TTTPSPVEKVGLLFQLFQLVFIVIVSATQPIYYVRVYLTLTINTSRGPLVVEEDLAEALNSGKIAGATVDVVLVEPIRNDNPLITAKNSIITPHIAWAPKESRERLMNIAVDNLKSFLAGNPVNVVNK
ncbi:MAG: hypothetical protein GX211_08010, partial [Clostridiaceae bacterium]|nr:hypothetical protein [Clostridiaceae bacterium]